MKIDAKTTKSLFLLARNILIHATKSMNYWEESQDYSLNMKRMHSMAFHMKKLELKFLGLENQR